MSKHDGPEYGDGPEFDGWSERVGEDVYDLPDEYRISLPLDDGEPEFLNDEAGYYGDASLDPLEILIAEEEAEELLAELDRERDE